MGSCDTSRPIVNVCTLAAMIALPALLSACARIGTGSDVFASPDDAAMIRCTDYSANMHGALSSARADGVQCIEVGVYCGTLVIELEHGTAKHAGNCE